jgi:predicted PurR-regulated permease PerM
MRTSGQMSWGRWIFYALAVLAAIWLAWAGRALWFPLAIAFVIAMVLDPMVDRLENRRVPRGLATALVFLLFIGGMAAAIIVLSPGVSEQAGRMSQDLARLSPDPDRLDLVPITKEIMRKLDAHPALRDALVSAARTGTRHLTQTLNSASEWALAWAPNLVWFLIVPILAFYLLMDFHKLYAKGILLVPRRNRPFVQTLVAEISAMFGKYLRGLALISTMVGLSVALLLWAFGNPYWQLLGLLAGLLYSIPMVGPLFTQTLIVLVTLVTGSPAEALIVGGSLVVLMNGVFDNFITPRVLGRQVGLHPVFIILALLLGAQVWGILGMLVAVPVAACFQLVLVHLVPKLSAELELRPLEELEKTEAETRAEHLRAEEQPLDKHFCLHSVVENVDTVDGAPDAAPAAKPGTLTPA